MDVRSLQSSPVYAATIRNRGGVRAATEEPAGTPARDEPSSTTQAQVFTTDEKSFFEGLFPEFRNDIRAYQAYSGKGEQQKSAPTGTLVDRKG